MSDLRTLGKAMRDAQRAYEAATDWDDFEETEKAMQAAEAAFDKALSEPPAALAGWRDIASAPENELVQIGVASSRKPGIMWVATGRVRHGEDENPTVTIIEHYNGREFMSGFRGASHWMPLSAVPAPTSEPPAALAEDALPFIEAAEKQLIAYSVGSCTCGIKSPDIHYHNARCAYRAMMEILENVEAARKALSEPPVAQAGEIERLKEALRVIAARASGERYDGTPYEPDDANTDAEKELVGMLNCIEATALAALAASETPASGEGDAP